MNNKSDYESKDLHLERLRRKRDQSWDLAGCARQDGDKTDEARHTADAREYERQIKEYLS